MGLARLEFGVESGLDHAEATEKQEQCRFQVIL
jgi:hypothetical protein